MHESSLIDRLISQVKSVAEAEGANQVTAISLRLGALSQFTPEHFQEHFDQQSIGTIAEGAKLLMQVSDDIHDPHAQRVILTSVDVEELESD